VALKAAIVGLGKQARKCHLPGILSSKVAKLVAVCDIDTSKIKEISQQLNVPGYASIDELLKHESLDFVIIATPHDTHLSIIEKVARKGIHVLKEKPFAINIEEGQKMVELVEKNNIELKVTLQRRFNENYQKFFNFIKEIGQPSFIDIKYSIFAENPHPAWRAKKEHAGGGCILDMGYHMVDLLVWFFGLPESVYATFSTVSQNEKDTEVEDSASIIFEYENKCVGNIQLSRYSQPKTEYVKVIGQNGILELLKDKINLYGKNGVLNGSFILNALSDIDYSEKQISAFVQTITNRESKNSEISSYLSHMKFIDACYRSRQSGKAMNPRSTIKIKPQILEQHERK
jgi:predicted dehydrogenase